MPPLPAARGRRIWLFDLDDTLHDASGHVFPALREAMAGYVAEVVGLPLEEAARLARAYWARYGTTLSGLQRHHGVRAAHFLQATHRLPGLEAHLQARGARSRRDLAAVASLPGLKVVLTNAPRAYAERVLRGLGAHRHFHALVAIEDMQMFGQLRPKPDARMFRRLLVALKASAAHCVLVEDTLAHQKAAHGLGLGTVWMQGHARRAGQAAWAHAQGLQRRPPYVGWRVQRLAALKAIPGRTP